MSFSRKVNLKPTHSTVVKNEDDAFVSDQKDILKHLQSFYCTLYSSHSNADHDQMAQYLDQVQFQKLYDGSKTDLDKPISRSEILASLKELKFNKNPWL